MLFFKITNTFTRYIMIPVTLFTSYFFALASIEIKNVPRWAFLWLASLKEKIEEL